MRLWKRACACAAVGSILALPINAMAADSDLVYATENVNIRREPTVNSESIGCLKKNHSIEKIEDENPLWTKVSYDGEEFYIFTTYLTDENPMSHYELLGEFKITAYCGRSCCNGRWAGSTSTGVTPYEGTTIAVAPWVIPYGTEVYIEGVGTRIAQDTGGFANRNDHQIDLYFASHGSTNDWGVQYRNVWIKTD